MINFPSNPVDGQAYIVGSIVYQYSTTYNRWRVQSTTTVTSVTVSSFDCFPSTAAGYFSLPAGLICQVSKPGQGGNQSYSTSTGLYPGTSWVHVFTSPGQLVMSNQTTASFLLVGGGGQGGGATPPGGTSGGGGAGGVVAGTMTLLPGTYSVSVGLGGGVAGNNCRCLGQNSGTPSIFAGCGPLSPQYSITAQGGGHSGIANVNAPGTQSSAVAGGSGGGGNVGSIFYQCGALGTQPGQAQSVYQGSYTNYGNRGATRGGGGGAGGTGQPGACSAPGAGGSGISSSITGASATYATGGGATPRNGSIYKNASGNGGVGVSGVGTAVAASPGIVVISYPTNENNGAIRYDITANVTEVYSTATHSYRKIGRAGYPVDILIVGGGGGGGGSGGGVRGGGGGGGSFIGTNFYVITGTSYTVTVGAGGASNGTQSGGAGGSSSFGFNAPGAVMFTSPGGGYGNLGCASYPTAGAGGSTPVSNSGWGFKGSFGGGAGAGGCGQPSGQGGVGVYWVNGLAYSGGGSGGVPYAVWTNLPQWGGGGGSNCSGVGIPGSVNSGGGGGGGNSTGPAVSGGAGGSGVVILRYSGTVQKTGTLGGNSITVSGCYVYHTFTGSGTYKA